MPDDRYPPGPARGVPGADGSGRRDAAVLLARMAREYGDVAAFKLGRQDVVLLSHPDDIEDVLVRRARSFRVGTPLERAKGILGEGLLTSEGDAHLRRRRLAQPAFHRRCIAAHADAILRRARRLSGTWRDGEAVDMAEEMNRLTLGVAGEALFGADLDAEGADLAATFGEAMALYNVTAWTAETRERVERVRARLDALVYGLIARRRPGGVPRDDVLSALLSAGLSDTELRDELVTLLFAGHETVANALAWTWYLLAEHPPAERRLHAELATALPRGPSGYADLERLPYVRAVFSESLRLYPPGWVIGRTAREEYAVRGHTMPAGTVVLVSQWVTHRDPRWFPEPERFDPDRWLRPDPPARPRYAYFPFGGGTRKCLGEGLAWLEGTLLLAALAGEWRPRLEPGCRVEPQPLVTLRPRYGLPMRLEHRDADIATPMPDGALAAGGDGSWVAGTF